MDRPVPTNSNLKIHEHLHRVDNQCKTLVFAKLELPVVDKLLLVNHFNQYPIDDWVWDSYREVHMLPLYTHKGGTSLDQIKSKNNSGNNYTWTPYAPQYLIDYFNKFIWPISQQYGRVMLLKTKSGAGNKEHIDCLSREYGNTLLKMRIVLSSKVSTLYFVTKNDKISPPDIDSPFLMNGAWPHGMKNNSTEDKLTICLGSPWVIEPKFILDEQSIYFDQLELPNDIAKFL